MKEDIVYLTFPTNKETAHALTDLAHIKGTTQPKLLNEICQEYLSKEMIKVIELMEKADIDINKLTKDVNKQCQSNL